MVTNPTNFEQPTGNTRSPISSSRDPAGDGKSMIADVLESGAKFAAFTSIRNVQEKNRLQEAENALDYARVKEAYTLAWNEKLNELDRTEFPSIEERESATQKALQDLQTPFANKFTNPLYRDKFSAEAEQMVTQGVLHERKTHYEVLGLKTLKAAETEIQDGQNMVFANPFAYTAVLNGMRESIPSEGLKVTERAKLDAERQGSLALAASLGDIRQLMNAKGTTAEKIQAIQKESAELLGGSEERPYFNALTFKQKRALIDNLDQYQKQLIGQEVKRIKEEAETEAKLLTEMVSVGAPVDANVKAKSKQLLADLTSIGEGNSDLGRQLQFTINHGEEFYRFRQSLGDMSEARVIVALNKEDPRNNPERWGADLPLAIEWHNKVKSSVMANFEAMKADPALYAAQHGKTVGEIQNRLGTPANDRINLTKDQRTNLSVEVANLYNPTTGQLDYFGTQNLFQSATQQLGRPLTPAEQNKVLADAGVSGSEIASLNIVQQIQDPQLAAAFVKAWRTPSTALATSLTSEQSRIIDNAFKPEIAKFVGAMQARGAAGGLPYTDSFMKAYKNEVYRRVGELGGPTTDNVKRAIEDAKESLGLEANKVGRGYLFVNKPEAENMKRNVETIANNPSNYTLQGALPVDDRLVRTLRPQVGSPTFARDTMLLNEYFSSKLGVPSALLKTIFGVESGGAQYNKDGSLKRSPSGALGRSQVMPHHLNLREDKTSVPEYYARMYEQRTGERLLRKPTKMPDGKTYQLADLEDPFTNVAVGSMMLAANYESNKHNIINTAAIYNGSSAVRKWTLANFRWDLENTPGLDVQDYFKKPIPSWAMENAKYVVNVNRTFKQALKETPGEASLSLKAVAGKVDGGLGGGAMLKNSPEIPGGFNVYYRVLESGVFKDRVVFDKNTGKPVVIYPNQVTQAKAPKEHEGKIIPFMGSATGGFGSIGEGLQNIVGKASPPKKQTSAPTRKAPPKPGTSAPTRKAPPKPGTPAPGVLETLGRGLGVDTSQAGRSLNNLFRGGQ